VIPECVFAEEIIANCGGIVILATMPRLNGQGSLEAQIGAIISAAASQIAAAVRQDMAAQLQRLVAGVPRVTTARTAVVARSSRAGNPGGKGIKRNIPKTCIYPGCNNPSKGPRWSFLCEKHLETPKAERQKLLASWKAGQGGGSSSANGVKAKPGKRGRRGGRRARASASA
jgi:hypothetical protein